MDLRKFSILLTGCVLIGCAEGPPSRFTVIKAGLLQVPVRVVPQAQMNENFVFWNSNGTFCYFADTSEHSGKEITKDNATLVCHSIIANRAIAQLSSIQFSDTVDKINDEADLIVGSCFVYVSEQTSESTVLKSCAADRPPKLLKLPFVYGIQSVIGSSQYLAAYRYVEGGVFAYILDQDLNVRWKFEAAGVPEIPDKLMMVSDRVMSYTFQVKLGDSVARELTEAEGKEFVERLSEFERPKTVKPDLSWRITDGRLYLKDLSTQLETQIDIRDRVLTATILSNKKQIVALSRSNYFIISYK